MTGPRNAGARSQQTSAQSVKVKMYVCLLACLFMCLSLSLSCLLSSSGATTGASGLDFGVRGFWVQDVSRRGCRIFYAEWHLNKRSPANSSAVSGFTFPAITGLRKNLPDTVLKWHPEIPPYRRGLFFSKRVLGPVIS